MNTKDFLQLTPDLTIRCDDIESVEIRELTSSTPQAPDENRKVVYRIAIGLESGSIVEIDRKTREEAESARDGILLAAAFQVSTLDDCERSAQYAAEGGGDTDPI
jgi:hypothetical protein